jgi:transposase
VFHGGEQIPTVDWRAAIGSCTVAARGILPDIPSDPGEPTVSATQPVSAGRMATRPSQSAVAQICETAQALVDEGRTAEAFDCFAAALEAVLRKNTELELLLAKLRRERLGTRSERISPEQLALLLESMQQLEPAEPEANAVAKAEAEARQDAELDAQIEQEEKTTRERRRQKQPRGRSWHVRRAKRCVHQVSLAAEERTCGSCGDEKRRIGVDITRRLELVPAHFIEHVYHREKYACSRCKKGVITAPGPAKVMERSDADATVLAHVAVSKFADHTPLHRLHRIYSRSGVHIPVSTLADWVAGVADRVQPVVDLLAQRVRAAYVVATDATGLKVLDPTSPVNIERGTMWCYVGDHRDVFFHYTPTGEGAGGPWSVLAGRTGPVQADAGGVFDRLFTGQAASAIEVGCWAHARRKFVALAQTDSRVAYPLQLIRRLYRLEYLADLKQMTPAERAALRGERTRDTLDRLKRWLLVMAEQEPPSSEMAKATGYCLRQWTALTRFLDDGRLAPDNNNCEQQLRDIALGRKNYLFAGSHGAARRAATLYSLMRTCAQHDVAPLPYLTDVLRKLAQDWPSSRLEELLPDNWQRLHAPPDESPA